MQSESLTHCTDPSLLQYRIGASVVVVTGGGAVVVAIVVVTGGAAVVVVAVVVTGEAAVVVAIVVVTGGAAVVVVTATPFNRSNGHSGKVSYSELYVTCPFDSGSGFSTMESSVGFAV